LTDRSTSDIAISYRRSGGIAGVDLVAELHSGDLTADDAAVVRNLLARPPAAKPASSAPRPDQFDHELTLAHGSSRQAFHWSDGEVPDEARPLLAALRRRAEPTRS
jgi:hypothetical protein